MTEGRVAGHSEHAYKQVDQANNVGFTPGTKAADRVGGSDSRSGLNLRAGLQRRAEEATSTASSETQIPGMVELESDDQMQIKRQMAAVEGDSQGEPVTSPAQQTDPMLVDKGLVWVSVVFSTTTRRGVGFRRRGIRGAGRRGAVARKRGRPIDFLEFGVEEVRDTKRRHLMDEDSDIISAEAAPAGRHEVAWNCQGLGSPWTIRSLAELIRLHNPVLIFLSETKCKKRKCDILKERFNMFRVNVDSKGKSGGLILLWRKDMNVILHSFSDAHIDVGVASEDGSGGWRFIEIYGHPEATHRGNTWHLLRTLSSASLRPWLCIGDFNEILNPHEKNWWTAT
ncbi:UNVERIFIED_CONTAM: hypothetical protein Slati_2716600 [Sesamum latifolium]|uniref:Endonuclease/exonuclease/phosphatase domain-containing protein n=1 Tax=Sesamum latifolium TaxID=2727402 RepID=A0AAW2VXN4_9LAMI